MAKKKVRIREHNRTRAQLDYILQKARETAETAGRAVTLRQIHYDLAMGAIRDKGILYLNCEQDYNNLSKMLSKARLNGGFPYEYMEDRSRIGAINGGHVYTFTPADELHLGKSGLEERIRNAPTWEPGEGFMQRDRVVILLEKKTLQEFIKPVMLKHNILAVAGGFESTTIDWTLSELIKSENKKFPFRWHFKVFTDYDPSGESIGLNFMKKLLAMLTDHPEFVLQKKKYKITSMDELQDLVDSVHSNLMASIDRIGLTREQIVKWNLPSAPVKVTDSRGVTWNDPNGTTELDALSIDTQQEIIIEAQRQHFDARLDAALQHSAKFTNRRLAKRWKKIIVQIAHEMAESND